MNSRDKGKRGEREWAAYLRDEFGQAEARRGQQHSGSPDSPDVKGGWPGTHAEVKRVERLNIHEAMEQAVRDKDEGEVPYVAHRRNRGVWLVTVPACYLGEFARIVHERSLDEALGATEADHA